METLVFETDLGYAALARQDGRVSALAFGHTSKRAVLKALERTLLEADASPYSATQADYIDAGVDELVDRIRAFAHGDVGGFDDLQIKMDHLTPFAKKVTAVCRKIGWGETLTYGELAKRAGRPGAARAVGRVMARNRTPLIVPCHRVVAASGKLGGFSAPQGVSMKKRLLEMESSGLLLLK